MQTQTRAPLVSVIVPSYNYATTLPACLEAILGQSYPELEVIVVDDHSSDGSKAVADSYPVTSLQTPVNGGVAAARNFGVAQSTGDVLFFVDADVVLSDDAIDNAMTLFATDPGIVSVCGIYEPTPLIRDSLWEEFRSLQAYVWRISSIGDVSGGFFSLGGIRRAAFEAVGPFNTGLRQTEEIDYGERLTRQGRIVLSDLVRGQHDDDHALWPMLRKLWRRSRDRVPFYFAKKGPMKGFELPRRLMGTALCGMFWAAACATLFAPALWGLPVAMLAAMIWVERDIHAEAWRRLGAVKWPAFALWYFLFHTAAGLGVASGLVKFATSREFRGLYGSWDGHATQG